MRRLPLLLSALVVLGCGSDIQDPTLPATDANVIGTFSLASANGRALPLVAFVTTDEEWDMTSDQFVIAADNTWNETTNYVVTSFTSGASRTTSSQSVGTYALANGKINFTITSTTGNTTFTGSVSGNTLAVLFNGGQFLYQR